MKRGLCVAWIALSLVACGEANFDDAGDGSRGVLSLSLTGVDSAGVSYRLRGADFVVSGYPDYVSPPYGNAGGVGGDYGYAGYGGYYAPGYVSKQLSSEDDPDSPTITTKLVPGYYNVELLNSGWYLERTTSSGTERVEKVVLLSPTYQGVYVWDGGVAQVNYRFGVDGELIDFRSGDLEIGIEIEKPGEHCEAGYGGYAGYYGYAGYPGTSTCGSAGASGTDVIAGAGGVAGSEQNAGAGGGAGTVNFAGSGEAGAGGN